MKPRHLAILLAGCLAAACTGHDQQPGEDTDDVTPHVVPLLGLQDLRHWAGEGDNRAALAIQWTTDTPPDTLFLAWGFRWPTGEGQAPEETTGIHMVKAVAAADPRLFVLLRESPLGTLLLGFGYDGNGDGRLELRAKTATPSPASGTPPVLLTEKDFPLGLHDAGTSGIDPDNLTVASDGDWWISGWQTNYLTYWNHEGEWITPDDDFTYAPLGASLRVLHPGSWDAWTLSPVTQAETNTPPLPALLRPAP